VSLKSLLFWQASPHGNKERLEETESNILLLPKSLWA